MVSARSELRTSKFIAGIVVPCLFLIAAAFGWRVVVRSFGQPSFGTSLVAWCMWLASPALSAIIATFYYPRRSAYSGYRVAFAVFVSYSVIVVALFVLLNTFARQ